jgi:uncharacterized membrane protein
VIKVTFSTVGCSVRDEYWFDGVKEEKAMQKTRLGLDERIECVLAYSLLWVSGLFFFLFEKNVLVRRHALQSLVTFGLLSLAILGVNILNGILSWIPVLGWIISFGLGLLARILSFAILLLWVWLMYMAYTRPQYRLPIVSDIIDAI